MFKIPIQICDKKILIEPYKTIVEKDILIMSSFGIFEIDEVLRILNLDAEIIKSLSTNEKKVLLYKYRETSIGDEIEIKFKCKNCGTTSEGTITAADFIEDSERNDDYILKIDKEVTEENLQDFIKDEYNINVLELDLDEFDQLLEKVKLNQNNFNFVKTCTCLKCRKENYFDIGDETYIIEHLSENTLMSIYKVYNNMIMFGNMSKQDIDSMYPFERTLFIGLINKTKEELAK